MEYEKIYLWPEGAAALNDGVEDDFKPYMTFHPSTKPLPNPQGGRPLMMVFPGGGYHIRADHEGIPVAERFNELGFNSLVVQYRVSPHRFPAPQQDAFRAIQLARANADKFQIDPKQIATVGFSAGGHLAGSIGTMFDDPTIDSTAGDAADSQSRRPDANGLSYAVLTSGPFTHVGSMQNLQGDKYPTLNEALAIEYRVNDQTPPTFLWSTVTDNAVPVQNTLLVAESMISHHRPVEVHLFPVGNHGLGLAPEHQDIAQWPALYAQFLRTTAGFNC